MDFIQETEREPTFNGDYTQEDNHIGDRVGWDYTKHFTSNQVFNSRDELTSWCKQVGRSCGVVVGIKKSDYKKYGRRARITYACERSGQFKASKKKENNKKPTKHTGTKKCDCPFLLKGINVTSCI
ncbi:hypothetical protein LguiA_022024 [Lonicera macranthoides]